MRLTEKHLRFEVISGTLAPLYWINENDVAVEMHNGQYGGGNAIDKLGQLEDILQNHNIETLEELDGLLWYVKQIKNVEDELGIDLITLIKAIILNQDFWYKDKKGLVLSTENEISLNMDGDGLVLNVYHIGYFFAKDYGKTWALTKEELEDGN